MRADGGHIAGRRWAIAGFGLAAALISLGVWWVTLTSQLDALEQRGRSDLDVAADRLVSQLQRFRELAVLLADHPQITALYDGGPAAPAAAMLQRTADKTGSLTLLAMETRGRVLARTGESSRPGLADTPYVLRAMRDGALGSYHGVDPAGPGDQARRVFTFAAPVHAEGGPPLGATVVRAEVGAIEAEWRGDALAVFFTDALGVVFSTNRSELLFRSRVGEPRTARSGPDAGYAEGTVRPFLDLRVLRLAGHDLWRMQAEPYLPRTSIHITRPLPVIGMTGEALVNAGPAFRLAGVQGLATAATLLIFGVALLGLADRRRDLARRLAEEARTTALLEQRVIERTTELSAANAALRREIEERLAAEAALRRAQDDLVQAGKMSALGQMSAGISHELNQPLMAISSFAENAGAFLERGRTEAAAANLSRIGALAHRMGRIIRNLRAFARQEVEPTRPVDLVAVVQAALEISEGRLASAGIHVAWTPPSAPVRVRGGDVRLQQVVLNLVSNAVDAMEGQSTRRLGLAILPGAPVRLTVSDTGSGLGQTDRIFDPFYTTKEVGRAEGMGLGLSISYGIVTSFGGAIRGENRPDGGAVFTVELQPVGDIEAAA